MKLISKEKVNNTFSIATWFQGKGYKPNFDYIILTTYRSSYVYALFDSTGDNIITYTIVVIDGYRYVFEMTKGSRDVKQEFIDELSNNNWT